MVFVLSKNNIPLMPTEDHRAVRLLLKEGKAEVVRRTPFTIRLLVTTNTYTQPVTLGVDAGSRNVGMSATTETKELYASETELRGNVSKLLSTRRECRRERRNRKTRYRKPRFDNRAKQKGWLAPSIAQKIDSHIQLVKNVHKILPVTKVVVEVASFDIQKIKNPDIEGKEYQQGDQFGFWNAREYVLWRDGYTCQCCKGKSKDKVLNVHHIESRKTGGNAPNNMITLCETCHHGYHKGLVELPKHIRRGMVFRDAVFMGIMRREFYDKLKTLYPNVHMTYGYITKNARIRNGIEKSHIADARCISGHLNAEPAAEYFYQKCMRRHNRQTHKMTINKGGTRKLNQAPKYTKGYQLFDKVWCKGQVCFVWSRRSSGYFAVKTLNGDIISNSINYKELTLFERTNSILCERRSAPPNK